MVVIRLARFGSTHRPKYRVTVADQRRHATGRFIEVIGNYDPLAKDMKTGLRLDLDRVKSWVAKGAQPTKRVKYLISKAESQA